MNASPLRLLLVDDHALYLTGLRLMLADGWPAADVRVASTWSAAMAELAAQPADLVLLDIHLPDAHGLASMPMLRALAPQVPVLVMSADVTGELVRQAREAGACGYLHKSAAPAEVVAAVRACLQGGQAWAQLPYDLLSPAVALPAAAGVGEGALALSAIQVDILRHLEQGATNKGIARQLGLSEADVRAELSWVTESLNASSREQACARARELGLLQP